MSLLSKFAPTHAMSRAVPTTLIASAGAPLDVTTSAAMPDIVFPGHVQVTSPRQDCTEPAWIGPTAGHEETVALHELAANPRHPRDDWQAEDDALELLGNSLAGPSGQIHPLLCTPLPPDLDVQVIPVTARFLVIDGHRRLVAMERLGMQHARVLVLTTLGGEPLTPVERLTQWFVAAASAKKPTTQQTILALVRLYLEWEHQHSDAGSTRRFPSQRAIANRLHVSLGTVNHAMRVARQPHELVRAMTSGSLQVTAAQAILDDVPDEQVRIQMVRDVLRQNEQRRQAGRARLTVDEIREICRARGCQVPTREPARTVTPRGSAELVVTPGPQASEGAERAAARETTARRHAMVTEHALMEMRGRFSGLHVLDLLMEDPAPDDVRVFAALALDVVDWHGKVQAHRNAHLPKFVRAPCAALSNQRVVGLLQSLLART